MFRDDEYRNRNESELENENLKGSNMDFHSVNSPTRILTATALIGDEVEDPSGESLGEIKDIMLNLNTGCTEYMVLEFGGVLGMGSKYFAIPFLEFTVNVDRHVLVLDRNREYLMNAPGFDRNHWPSTNSEHFNSVNEYWDYEKVEYQRKRNVDEFSEPTL